jgi:photosynthetic reaction center cytochrome c subunit
MRLSFRISVPQLSWALALAGFALSTSFPPKIYAQSATAPAPTQKTAEQQFKNIQMLKGVPADQVIPTMQFISASLGVECEFCHVEHAFDKDDKKTKQVARQMIEMQMGINKNSFKGETEVTCNTCHRGSNRPMAIPAVADANWKPNPPRPEAAPSSPPAPQDGNAIIAKYIDALGGTAALQKIKSISEKGSTEVNGRQTPIDIYAKAPDARVSFMHVGNGDSVTAYNGKAGWLASPGRPIHDMSASESSAAKLSAIFTFPDNLDREFTRTRVGRPDKIDDRSVTPVFGMREGQPPVRMFFDDQSGLLTRIITYTETPLGRSPTQVDYADYRDVNGVKTPYRWTISRPASRFTIQLTEVKPNAPIDESKFVRPPDPPTTPDSQTITPH